MMYNNLLSKEELEALLTPKELEVFVGEQQGRQEHELRLSPAHLLIRELEDIVGRLTARVEHLEQLQAEKPYQAPQIIHNDPYIEYPNEPEAQYETQYAIIENQLNDIEVRQAESYFNNQLDVAVESEFIAQDDSITASNLVSDEEETERFELLAKTEEEPEFASLDEVQADSVFEEGQTEFEGEATIDSNADLVEEYPTDQLLESHTAPEDADITNEEIFDRKSFSMLANKTNSEEEDPTLADNAFAEPSFQESNLLSRSARHRERKPSLLSRLLR